MTDGDISGSFRDPNGFVFFQDGEIYRQVNNIYKDNYDYLMSSGLYQGLTTTGLLIPHDEVSINYAKSDDAYKILKPELVPYISYPYEWCFSQLKNAALTTLHIQKIALNLGMTLKDCSAYNIQFVKGEPTFIDTLSFEKYQEGEPWVAYRQFCQHFLAPLSLMSYKDIRLNQLFRVFMDGIPLDLANSLLPFRTRFNFPLLLHVHFHSASQKRYADKPLQKSLVRKRVSPISLLGLIDSLESCINKMKWQPKGTEWYEYYTDDSYTPDAIEHKKLLVSGFLDEISPKTMWDFGANTGIFSRIASDKGIDTVSFDIDPACVEINYLAAVEKGESNILPLFLDLTNPSPGIGWENRERLSISERGRADTILALALIHHLVISNNLPLSRIASFFKKICNHLIIEFVPKGDPKVQKLLATKKDIFPNYTQEAFETEFSKLFSIQTSINIRDSQRTLYLMVNRES